MEYTVILIAVLLLSPLVLKIASSQDKKTKRNLRFLYLILLASQIMLGFLNWETFQSSGRSGFELALTYPSSFLGLFFAISFIQVVLLLFKQHTLDILSVVLNFINTALFIAAMIIISNILGKQIVNLASIAAIFVVLSNNVVGLVLINQDKNLLKKHF